MWIEMLVFAPANTQVRDSMKRSSAGTETLSRGGRQWSSGNRGEGYAAAGNGAYRVVTP